MSRRDWTGTSIHLEKNHEHCSYMLMNTHFTFLNNWDHDNLRIVQFPESIMEKPWFSKF